MPGTQHRGAFFLCLFLTTNGGVNNRFEVFGSQSIQSIRNNFLMDVLFKLTLKVLRAEQRLPSCLPLILLQGFKCSHSLGTPRSKRRYRRGALPTAQASSGSCALWCAMKIA